MEYHRVARSVEFLVSFEREANCLDLLGETACGRAASARLPERIHNSCGGIPQQFLLIRDEALPVVDKPPITLHLLKFTKVGVQLISIGIKLGLIGEVSCQSELVQLLEKFELVANFGFEKILPQRLNKSVDVFHSLRFSTDGNPNRLPQLSEHARFQILAQLALTSASRLIFGRKAALARAI